MQGNVSRPADEHKALVAIAATCNTARVNLYEDARMAKRTTAGSIACAIANIALGFCADCLGWPAHRTLNSNRARISQVHWTRSLIGEVDPEGAGVAAAGLIGPHTEHAADVEGDCAGGGQYLRRGEVNIQCAKRHGRATTADTRQRGAT